jgi:MFS family permease
MAAMRLPAGWYAIAGALGHRNFGIYVAGNSASLIGTWMQRIGVGWLAWELSHSGAVLGLVAFADLFPTVVIGPFGGVLADRADRLRVIKVAQSLIMLQAFALFAFTWSGLITVEILIALVLVQGVVIGFNQPARLALIPSLIPRPDLATAVAINSIVFNTARFIGPALAGLIIASFDVAAVFALNGLSFVAFLFALSRLRIEREIPNAARPRTTVLAALWEGVRYAMAHPGIGPILVLHAVMAVCARPFVELLPGFAAEVFDRGASGLAILSSSVGLGAIVGGLWLAQNGRTDRQTTTALASGLLVALSTLGFALSGWFPLATFCVALAGLGMVGAGVATQTIMQTAVEDGMRGRTLSLFGLIQRGGPAIGALAMGAASEATGLSAPLAAGALIGLLTCLWGWRRRVPIARSLGEGSTLAPP